MSTQSGDCALACTDSTLAGTLHQPIAKLPEKCAACAARDESELP